MRTEEYQEFAENVLGTKFKNIDLLITALTHRSYLNEHKKTAKEHNERLEFLGDAVLELVVTEYLYLNYEEAEGILTNWRSSLVRTESLSESANILDIEKYLRLSKGELHAAHHGRIQILANCFEAIIGAIYLDSGYESAKDFITRNIINKFDDILEKGSWIDPKSKFQELTQKEGHTPNYRVISELGPDHDKNFVVGVYVDNKLVAEGSGRSKQLAQQSAARVALKQREP